VISPRAYCASTFSTRSSYSARIASLSGGMTMSFFEIVTPACVAYLNPRLLIMSSTLAIECAPYSSTSSAMNASSSRFGSVRFMKSCSGSSLS
jgi:hypothetical protein